MLKDRLDNDLKAALKNKDDIKVSTLRLLKAALHNAEIAKQQELKDEDIIVLIKKQLKQRRDSIEEFKKGNRQDLVDKETKESEVLKAYLPEELEPEELFNIVKEVITEANATSMKDMGRVMKEVMAKTKGRADGKAVSDLVKDELSKNETATGAEGPKDDKNKDSSDK